MWSQSVDLLGLGLRLTFTQIIILTAFVGLVVGWALRALVGRRRAGAAPAASQDKERATSNVAFMKGINYILSDKYDQAIEELTRAVSVDTETVETYIALGNLFRSKGEIDRAIRIRQSIILRPNLDPKIKQSAMYDLGLDFRRGGFYERAITTFEEILRADSKMTEAYRQLTEIYEETRDWNKAYETTEKAAKLTGRKVNPVLAHYQVEMGKAFFEAGRLSAARAAYKKALTLDSGCVDAYLHLGDLLVHEGKPKKALAVWRKIVGVAPDMTFLTFGRLARMTADMKDLQPLEEFLAECADNDTNPLARLALARLLGQRGEKERAVAELEKALELDPAMYEARRELGFLLLEQGLSGEALAAYQDLLSNLTGPEASFQCGRCGFESQELTWRCPQCYAWDSMTLHRHRPQLFEPLSPTPTGPPEGALLSEALEPASVASPDLDLSDDGHEADEADGRGLELENEEEEMGAPAEPGDYKN